MSPLNQKGDKILRAMVKKYGKKKGTRVFYASERKGTITGVTKAAQGKVIPGPGLVQVGEGGRSEYAFLMPGSIVAPMRKGEKPTMAGGLRAVLEQLFKTVPTGKPRGAAGGFTAYPTGVNALLNSPQRGFASYPTGVNELLNRPRPPMPTGANFPLATRPTGGVPRREFSFATARKPGEPGSLDPNWTGRTLERITGDINLLPSGMGRGPGGPGSPDWKRRMDAASRRRLMGMQHGGEMEGDEHLPYGWQPKTTPTPKPAPAAPTTPASTTPTLPAELMNLPFLQRLMAGRRTSLLQSMVGTAQPFGEGVEMPDWQRMNYYDYLKTPEYSQQMTQAIASAFGMPPEQALEQSRRATGMAYGTPLQRGFVPGSAR